MKHPTMNALVITGSRSRQKATGRLERLEEFLRACTKKAKTGVRGTLMGVAMLTAKVREPERPAAVMAMEPADWNKKAVMESVVLNNQILRLGKTVVSTRERIEQGRNVVEIAFQDGSILRAKLRADFIYKVTMRKDGVKSEIRLEDALSHVKTGAMSGVAVSGPPGEDEFSIRMPGKPQEKSVVVFQMMNGDSIEIEGAAGSIEVEYFKP